MRWKAGIGRTFLSSNLYPLYLIHSNAYFKSYSRTVRLYCCEQTGMAVKHSCATHSCLHVRELRRPLVIHVACGNKVPHLILIQCTSTRLLHLVQYPRVTISKVLNT